eukprot:CAMPEP_0113845868 /NCGR_PEP_ID=MMETSP0372-20130328/992_1 /TAXON_ID=340204 /ORGANISM="Lankesteria abbotti" /LENGTH=299 /DNA_ID=CAMNT_0000814951 /DNA_START=100 /DNA_END=999 /DNA_ORIENTATION=- /assembly_acc=CAM_ASM_000359
MGAKISYTLDSCEAGKLGDEDVTFVSPSMAHNIVQLCGRRPDKYVIYDVRARGEYMKEQVNNSLWGWEKNVDFENQSDYHVLLRDESYNKTLLIFSDEKFATHIPSFFKNLRKAEASPLRLLVLREGMKSLKSPRYKSLTVGSKLTGPLEIIPPVKSNKAKGFGVFSGASSLCPQYLQAIKHFGISVIINVSSEAVHLPPNLTVEEFRTDTSGCRVSEVVSTISASAKKQKSVLILDDTGNDNAMACVVAFLVQEGKSVKSAVEFVKSKNYHADPNFMDVVHSIVKELRQNSVASDKEL